VAVVKKKNGLEALKFNGWNEHLGGLVQDEFCLRFTSDF